MNTCKEQTITFQDCVLEACQNHDLVREFDRLQGSHLSKILIPQPDTRPPIVRMIDEATGYDKHYDQLFHDEMQVFIRFIFETIWLPFISKGNPADLKS